MLRPACPGPAAPRSGSARRRRRLRREGSCAQPARPRPLPTAGQRAERGAGERPASPAPAPPQTACLAEEGESGAPQASFARASPRPSGEAGPRAKARLPSRRLHAARGACPRPSARSQPARLAPQVSGAGERGGPQPRTTRALLPPAAWGPSPLPQIASPPETPHSGLYLWKGPKRKKSLPGTGRGARTPDSERLSLAASRRVLPQRGLASSMPGAAAATQPRPRPGRCRRRRRLSRPSDDAAAGLPPRSERCPARARGAHTLTLAGEDSHTRTPASEGSAAAATRAGSGGGGGDRGGGGRGRRAGRRPITSASSRPLGSKVFTPGKKKVQGNRPGARRERERPRVGTREPEKEKQRQRES